MWELEIYLQVNRYCLVVYYYGRYELARLFYKLFFFDWDSIGIMDIIEYVECEDTTLRCNSEEFAVIVLRK